MLTGVLDGRRAAVMSACSGGRIMAYALVVLMVLLSRPDQALCHVTDANMPDAVAETEYQILLEFQPEKNDVRTKLAMILLRKKKFAEAETEFRTVLAAEPASFNAIDGLGLVMCQTGREKEAIDQFLKAIAITPDDVMVHYHLGLAYTALGDQAAAGQAYRRALALAEQPSAAPAPPSGLDEIRKALEANSALSSPQKSPPDAKK